MNRISCLLQMMGSLAVGVSLSVIVGGCKKPDPPSDIKRAAEAKPTSKPPTASSVSASTPAPKESSSTVASTIVAPSASTSAGVAKTVELDAQVAAALDLTALKGPLKIRLDRDLVAAKPKGKDDEERPESDLVLDIEDASSVHTRIKIGRYIGGWSNNEMPAKSPPVFFGHFWWAGGGDEFDVVRRAEILEIRERSLSEESAATPWRRRAILTFAKGIGMGIENTPD